MYKWLVVLLITTLLGCGSNEVDLNSNVAIKPSEFIEAFKTINASFRATDTSLLGFADTQKISSKVLENIVGDSILKGWMGDYKKTIFKPIGRINKKSNTYLLLLIEKKKKTGLTTLVFDNKNNFITHKDLIIADEDFEAYYAHSIAINGEPTFTVIREKTNYNGLAKYSKTGWALSNNNFIIVFNESNENILANKSILNPIDTFPAKNKFSGDYTIDERNLLSIRDGNSVNDYKFFLSIEKNDGKCIGELKGTMYLNNEKYANYSSNGDPCAIDFILNGNSITMKEKGSCGNRRGMECMFDDTFIKINSNEFINPQIINNSEAIKPKTPNKIQKPVVKKDSLTELSKPKSTIEEPVNKEFLQKDSANK